MPIKDIENKKSTKRVQKHRDRQYYASILMIRFYRYFLKIEEILDKSDVEEFIDSIPAEEGDALKHFNKKLCINCFEYNKLVDLQDGICIICRSKEENGE